MVYLTVFSGFRKKQEIKQFRKTYFKSLMLPGALTLCAAASLFPQFEPDPKGQSLNEGNYGQKSI